MKALHGAAEAGERLKQTALRDFGPPIDNSQRSGGYILELDRNTAPVPRLLMYALSLIGLQAHGPGEKVEWWVDFTYRGQWCELAHQKFGLRLYLRTEAPTAEARRMLRQIAKQLKSATRTVEKLILASAPDLLGQGDATVVNQHESLRRAYAYFRERAIDPIFIADEYKEYEPTDGLVTRVSTSTNGQMRMELNAFHDLVAAITAYLSLLEHDLVLALAFSGFDPSAENLTDVIGSRWGEKFRRVLGVGKEASRYRERLNAVVERWRNPYSHGGFEKGHGATIYLHAPGVGAVPVGLTAVRTSPLFSLIPATDTDVMQVFELFDDVDSWMESVLPDAIRWIRSGLNVRFDEDFRMAVAAAQHAAEFEEFLRHAEYRQEMVDNMDY